MAKNKQTPEGDGKEYAKGYENKVWYATTDEEIEKALKSIFGYIIKTNLTVYRIVEMHNLTRPTFNGWIRRNPDWHKAYAAAKAARNQRKYNRSKKRVHAYLDKELEGYEWKENYFDYKVLPDGTKQPIGGRVFNKKRPPNFLHVMQLVNRLEEMNRNGIESGPDYNFLNERNLNNVQKSVLFDPAKIKVVSKGRRVGLTYGLVLYCLQKATDHIADPKKYGPVNILWGDVGHKQIQGYIDTMFYPIMRKHRIPPDKYKYRSNDKELLIADSKITFRSAENPESWEGFDYHHIVLNEAGIVLKNKAYLWENTVKPMLMSKPECVVIMAGVPKQARGPFRNEYDLAFNSTDKRTKAFQFTSYDNELLNPNDIRLIEESMDILVARQELYGEFVDFVGRPFAYAFDAVKHVTDLEDDLNEPIYLSFDFNVDPITCIAVQQTSDGGINVIKEFRLSNSNIYELCTRITETFDTGRIWAITGDASGKARSALQPDPHMNYYTVIREQLGLTKTQIKLESANPSIENTRMLMNSILLRHHHFKIDSSCKYLIDDLKLVEVTESGDIDKKKDAQRTHLLDTLRYYLSTFHGKFVRDFG